MSAKSRALIPDYAALSAEPNAVLPILSLCVLMLLKYGYRFYLDNLLIK